MLFLSSIQAEARLESGHRCNNFSVDGEITELLNAWSGGDEAALQQLSEHVYGELRLMARRHMRNERPGSTLQTTALVHEVYLRLVGVTRVESQQRSQFFAMAARMMRRILVNQAISRGRAKRGRAALSLASEGSSSGRVADVVALHEALLTLARMDERRSRLVELRFFGGLTAEETAELLGVSVRTVHREWDLARAWLFRELRQSK